MQAKCPEYVIKTPSNYNMKKIRWLHRWHQICNEIRMLFIVALHIIKLNFLILETNLDKKTIIL